jgi:hypothetical protein
VSAESIDAFAWLCNSNAEAGLDRVNRNAAAIPAASETLTNAVRKINLVIRIIGVARSLSLAV